MRDSLHVYAKAMVDYIERVREGDTVIFDNYKNLLYKFISESTKLALRWTGLKSSDDETCAYVRFIFNSIDESFYLEICDTSGKLDVDVKKLTKNFKDVVQSQVLNRADISGIPEMCLTYIDMVYNVADFLGIYDELNCNIHISWNVAYIDVGQ